MQRAFSAFMLLFLAIQGYPKQCLADTSPVIIEENLKPQEEIKQPDFFDVLFSLNWKKAGKYKLNKSSSTFSVPSGYNFLTGKDAKTCRYMTCGEVEPNLEALLLSCCMNSLVILEYVPTGHIFINDWNEFDPDKHLTFMKLETEKNNHYKDKESCDLHIIDWIQKPTLVTKTKTIYWAINVQSEIEGETVNCIAFRLGRNGYEKFVWGVHKDSYLTIKNPLNQILEGFSFNPGQRYEDYRKGDAVAEHGLDTIISYGLEEDIEKPL